MNNLLVDFMVAASMLLGACSDGGRDVEQFVTAVNECDSVAATEVCASMPHDLAVDALADNLLQRLLADDFKGRDDLLRTINFVGRLPGGEQMLAQTDSAVTSKLEAMPMVEQMKALSRSASPSNVGIALRADALVLDSVVMAERINTLRGMMSEEDFNAVMQSYHN